MGTSGYQSSGARVGESTQENEHDWNGNTSSIIVYLYRRGIPGILIHLICSAFGRWNRMLATVFDCSASHFPEGHVQAQIRQTWSSSIPARRPQRCSLQYRYTYSRPRSPSRPNSRETTQPGPTDPSQCPEADSAHEGCQGDQSRTDLVERRRVVLKVVRQLFAGQIANQLSGHKAQ